MANKHYWHILTKLSRITNDQENNNYSYYNLFNLFCLIRRMPQSYTEKTMIAISKGAGSEHYDRYKQWLKSIDKDIECVDLTYCINDSVRAEIMSKASGLLLSGGPKVHPGRYGKEYDTARCYIDASRDTLEFNLLNIAIEKQMPILGICRGLQLLNVAFGGTLFVDILADFGSKIIHRDKEFGYCYHEISLIKNSMLYKLLLIENFTVNSFHHQGIEKLPDEFIANALSDDGFIEGIERKDTSKPFILAVQWHPECEPFQNTSKRIANKFIIKSKEYSLLKLKQNPR